MLLLFETPGGFAIFKVLDEGKLSNVEVIIFTCWRLCFLFIKFGNFYFKYVNLILVGFGQCVLLCRVSSKGEDTFIGLHL